MELYNMPLNIFHFLHCVCLNEQRSEEGRKNKENELENDVIEEAIGG